MYLLLKLGQVTLMHSFGNTSSQCFELSWCWGVVISSHKARCARNGTNTVKVWCGDHFPITIRLGDAAYLLVSRLKALFAFSSILRKLVGGSSNLAQHSLANTSADSHWSVDLQPPVFFHPPVWSQPQSIDQFKEHTLCCPSGEPTNKMSVSSYSIHCRWTNLVAFCPVLTHCYICAHTLYICR